MSFRLIPIGVVNLSEEFRSPVKLTLQPANSASRRSQDSLLMQNVIAGSSGFLGTSYSRVESSKDVWMWGMSTET
jgi:hypothetical protein